LFDHGFCFPGDGHQHRIRSGALQMQRRFKAASLSTEERASIDAVLSSGDLLGIAPLLEPQRARRMTARLVNLSTAPHVIPHKNAT
jgi:hypothetical protein